ncbi:MAG: NAD(+)/NADH kinase [Eubacteriaceae bacterium]|jgi:predicted polyphosphate/ATP-dependent NAD kinase|nr:NAD(+)/NADH kinase [Eubacteriaceae bacterium]
MSIGIIANPASGKDIRRLVSCATTIDNNEKVNIVKRITKTVMSLGQDKIYFMPDTFDIGFMVIDALKADREDVSGLEVISMPVSGSLHDSVYAGEIMEQLGTGCIIVLGGDGTSRAVAKGIRKTPMLPISTGTNNVYPTLIEGTVAGMAASALTKMDNIEDCCIRDKRIEVYVNGALRDIALVDATVSLDSYIGAKAIWQAEKIKAIIATRCHPATIGFSAVPGALTIVKDTDDCGVMVEQSADGTGVMAAIAAGTLERMKLTEPEIIPVGGEKEMTFEETCMIALDGEREVKVKPGEKITFKIMRNGPYRVLTRKTIEKAQSMGLYLTD